MASHKRLDLLYGETQTTPEVAGILQDDGAWKVYQRQEDGSMKHVSTYRVVEED